MTEYGPHVRRRILGRQLRLLRGQRGLKEVAAYTGISDSSISRIERGKQVILDKTVKALCQMYEVGPPESDMLIRQARESDDRGLLLDSDSAPDWAAPFIALEAEAQEIWTFQAQSIPGLLQTPDYIRALVAAAEVRGADPEGSVELRTSRQKRLTSPRPAQFHAILDEGVLRRVCADESMAVQQINRLIEMQLLTNVTVQVLPFAVGAHVAMTGSFTMLRFPDELDMNVVFLEHDHAGLMAERPQDLNRYAHMFESLRKIALSPEATSEWLASLAVQYRASGRGSG